MICDDINELETADDLWKFFLRTNQAGVRQSAGNVKREL